MKVLNKKKTDNMMAKKRGRYKPGKDCLTAMFRGIAEGDIKTLAIKDTNVSSLRTIAGSLNAEAGYQKYRVSVDTLLGKVRIALNV